MPIKQAHNNNPNPPITVEFLTTKIVYIVTCQNSQTIPRTNVRHLNTINVSRARC